MHIIVTTAQQQLGLEQGRVEEEEAEVAESCLPTLVGPLHKCVTCRRYRYRYRYTDRDTDTDTDRLAKYKLQLGDSSSPRLETKVK